MNAKLLEHIIKYREKHRHKIAQVFLFQKIRYQYAIVNKKENARFFLTQIEKQTNVQDIMLLEARAAREYWGLFEQKLNNKIQWFGRKPHNKDPLNSILDIGYHYLGNSILKICNEIDLPTELGFFHKAQSKNAHPFVYDFMEWLRPIVVDEVLLKIISKKKKPIKEIDSKLISYFIFSIKNRFGSYIYHRKFKYCIQFDYWIRLMLLEFISVINEDKEYKPLFPSLRHESRCKKTA